ncbi:putative wd40 protein [Aspergillus germanicus]
MSDPRHYTVGWICALETEYVAARAFLDKKHDIPAALSPNDNNNYTLGEIKGHQIVIAVLPNGEYGTSSAANVARDMLHSFPNIRFGLMVGIGGGAPSKNHDIRLGDIVVSSPRNGRGGLLQYDFGKDLQGEEFHQTGFLNQPPPILRAAVSGLRAQYEEEGHRLKERTQALLHGNERLKRKYAQPSPRTDVLYKKDFVHPNPETSCGKVCGRKNVIKRPNRTDAEDNPAIHYGLIASGNRVIKNAVFRDKLAGDEGVLCFEMEAAGLMNHFPCLVIRGICDYSDSHKNKAWQGYAAMVAAAYAKDLLCQIVPQRVTAERRASEILEEITHSLTNLSRNVDNIQSVAKVSAEKIKDVAHKIDLKELPIAEGAEFGTYMDQHEEECLPGTREDLLHRIEKWATSPEGKCMFWLNGLAGTGKSTITRTVANMFQKQKLLGASFFFKRGEGDRGNATRFFPTIARQLFARVPELRAAILQAIKENPGVSMKPYKEQFEELIYQPLCQVQLQISSLVIVIDALDECEGDNDIQIILQQLPRVHESRSVPLRFFLTSRPELPVRLGFQAAENEYQDLILHEIPASVIERDISLFLEHKLVKIRRQRDLGLDWPGEASFRTLLSMSIPLFISAATICRLFEDCNLDPEQCLSEILQYRNEESRLERTYLPVLNRVVSRYHGSRQAQIIRDVRELLGTIVLLERPLSMLSLSELTGLTSSALKARINSLHSVLNVPDSEVVPLRILHLSFRDFLLDPHTRDKTPFWVDEEEVNFRLGNYCLSVMRKWLRKNICQLQSHGTKREDIDSKLMCIDLPPELQYACRYWIHHVVRAKDLMIQIDYVFAFLEVHFLHWVEVMSILGIVSEVIVGIAYLQSVLPVNTSWRILEFLADAKRFILKNSQIADIAPLQIYTSGLLFAPKQAVIRKIFDRECPSWIRQWPLIDQSWGPNLQTLEGHSNRVAYLAYLAFSPDGQLLASGTNNGVVKVWDSATGALRHTLNCQSLCIEAVIFSPDDFFRHSIELIAYSPDGRLLASDARSGTIRIWDSATGALNHTLSVNSVQSPLFGLTFSPDGRQLASVHSDGEINLWDSTMGTLNCDLQDFDEGYSVAFSSSGHFLACGSDKTIQVWDISKGELKSILEGSSTRITSLTFSPDSQLLASGHSDNAVRLWDLAVGTLKHSQESHSELVASVAFSPDGRLLASCSMDSTVKLWEVATGTVKNTMKDPEASTDGMKIVIFSHDNRLLASGSDQGIVTLWDPATGKLKHTLDGYLSHPRYRLSVTSLVFSSNCHQLASGYGKFVDVWDLATMTLKHTLEGQVLGAETVAFSANGQMLAYGSKDQIMLWDLTTGVLKHTIAGVFRRFESIAFSLDGQLLASGSSRHIDIWDPVTGMRRHGMSGLQNLDSEDEYLETYFSYLAPRPEWFIAQDWHGSFVSEFMNQWNRPSLQDNRWLTIRGRRELWLPSEYSPSCSAIKDGAIAIGCKSGRVHVITFDV